MTTRSLTRNEVAKPTATTTTTKKPTSTTTTTTTTTTKKTTTTTTTTKKPNPDDYEFRKVCSTSFEYKEIYKKIHVKVDSSLPVIFAITPTYERPEMIAELTRLGQTLVIVPRVHWIIAQDSYNCSEIIQDLLNTLGLPYTYLISPMPKRFSNSSKAKPKGVSNRRAAMDWIKENGNDKDVFYFLDDDNTVNVKLFDEIRFTKKVSMFPVGLIGAYRVSSPIVKKGKVVGFYDSWPGGRKFQVDMAEFAVNVGFFRKIKKATMPYKAGYEENGFLKSLGISLDDIEPKAEECTKVLVWHTKTYKNKPTSLNMTKHTEDNIFVLVENMKKMSIIK